MTVSAGPVERRVFLCRPSRSVSFGIALRVQRSERYQDPDELSSRADISYRRSDWIQKIFISSVEPYSYAYYAGIKVNDQIVAVNENYCYSYEALCNMLQSVACRIVLDLLSYQCYDSSNEGYFCGCCCSYPIGRIGHFVPERLSQPTTQKAAEIKYNPYEFCPCSPPSLFVGLFNNWIKLNPGHFSCQRPCFALSCRNKVYFGCTIRLRRQSPVSRRCPIQKKCQISDRRRRNNFQKSTMIKRQPSYLTAIGCGDTESSFDNQDKQRKLSSRRRTSLEVPSIHGNNSLKPSQMLSVLCRSDSHCSCKSTGNVIVQPILSCRAKSRRLAASTSELINYQHQAYAMTVGLCATSRSSLNSSAVKFPLSVHSSSIMDRIDNEAVLKEGLVYCKSVSVGHRKAADRSWRGAWAVLHRSGDLFLCKDKHHMKVAGRMGSSSAHVLLPLTNVPFPLLVGGQNGAVVQLALDYKKKQRVFRLRSTTQGTELLLHTSDLQSFCEWLYELRRLCTADNADYSPPMDSRAESLKPPEAHTTKRKFVSSPLLRRGVSGCLRRGLGPGTAAGHKSEKSCGQKKDARHCNFGVPLDECQHSRLYTGVPLVIILLSKLIENFGASNVGVYRQTGSVQTTNWMIDELNKGVANADFSDIRWQDMKAVASTLKTFFARMPECLFGEDLYLKLLECARLSDENQFHQRLAQFIGKMSFLQRATLNYILVHFKFITSMSNLNKVDTKNIAIIFGPTLLWHRSRAPEESLAENPEKVRIIETLLQNLEYFQKHLQISTTGGLKQGLYPGNDDACSQDIIRMILKYESEATTQAS